jgi:predicted DCC family thiol-disulfide oxidoreductase YuxK
VDSIELYEAGRTYDRSTAALRIAGYLGGMWRLFSWARIIPADFRDRVYDFIAEHRYEWFGKLDACRIPTPSERARFLD